MPRYQKVGKSMITPLALGGNAFGVAVENYRKYSRLNFWDDLLYYLQTGYVICQPTIFAMFRPIERDGKRGWFVQMAVGEIGELLRYVPCPLDFIAFCRNDDDDMRVIEWNYFVEKVGEHYGFKKEEA
jgi:hypothetical protein